MPDRKNLTRYLRESTSFDGWRVCISKKGSIFTKYMSDRAFGGMEGSYEAARALRDEILQRLETEPADRAMEEYSQKFARRRKTHPAAFIRGRRLLRTAHSGRSQQLKSLP